MAINLNPVNLAALAALAGNSIGNLNLPVADRGAYGKAFAASLFDKQKLAQEYAKMQNAAQIQTAGDNAAMQRVTMQGQQSQELEQNKQLFEDKQKNMDRGLDQQKMEMMNALKQQELSQQSQDQQGQLDLSRQELYQKGNLGQQEIDIKRDQQEQDMFVNQMKSMSEMKKDERERLGSFGAVTSILAKQYENDPEGYAKMQQFLGQYGKQAGLIGDDVVSAFGQMNPQQAQAAGLLYANMSEHANTYAQQMGYGAKKGNAQGINISYDEQGQPVVEIGATKPTQNAAQQDLVNLNQNISQLQSIAKDYSKDFMTYKGAFKGAIGGILAKLDLGSATEDQINKATGGTIDPKGIKEFYRKKSEFTQQLNTFKFGFMKQMSGVSYSDRQLTDMLSAIVNEGDDPIAFEGKLNGFLKYAQAIVEAKTSAAQGNIKVGTNEYNQKFKEIANKNIMDGIANKSLPYISLGGKVYKSEDISKLAKINNMSEEQLLKEGGVLQ